MATAGPNNSGTQADDNAVGTQTWADVANVASSNDARSTSSGLTGSVSTHYLKCTNFGFSIPSGATIDGITVTIERRNTGIGPVIDNRVRIVKGGIVGSTEKAAPEAWPGVDGTVTYGGAADLWGETWADTDINASTFGVVLSAIGETQSGNPEGTPEVDNIQITINYTDTGGADVATMVASMGSFTPPLVMKREFVPVPY